MSRFLTFEWVASVACPPRTKVVCIKCSQIDWTLTPGSVVCPACGVPCVPAQDHAEVSFDAAAHDSAEG